MKGCFPPNPRKQNVCNLPTKPQRISGGACSQTLEALTRDVYKPASPSPHLLILLDSQTPSLIEIQPTHSITKPTWTLPQY